nr:uncharacterized protein LOC109184184 [Ipomoea batatas]
MSPPEFTEDWILVLRSSLSSLIRIAPLLYTKPQPARPEWPLFVTEHKRPRQSRALNDAAIKISAEEYEYEIFRSPEEYLEANLEPPRYDLAEKYTPKRAVVTVTVGPPVLEAGAMRSLPVSARSPALAKKISMGSKKAEPSRSADPTAEASVPIGLPLTTTHPADLSGEQDATRATKRGKEKEVVEVEEVATVKRSRRDGSRCTMLLLLPGVWQMAHSVTDLFARAKDGDEIYRREVAPLKKSLAKREQRIKELEGKLRTAEETGRQILERADLGENILNNPVLLAGISAEGKRPNDVRTALEVAIDDDNLPKILAVLPEEVPDPGPTPFSKVPDGSTLPVPVVGVFAGPLAEAVAIARPTAESVAAPSAGPTAEGDVEPRAELSAEAKYIR